MKDALDEALMYGMNACIPPCYLQAAADYAPSATIMTVVGCPQGQHATATKREEAVRAWEDGADELDTVINVGRLRADDAEAVTAELEEVVAAVPIPVKAIIETPLLSEAEKHRAAEAAVEADIAYLKTSTGFVGGGATVADVALLARYLPVNSSGGIRTWAKAEAMLETGADRIGTSTGVPIMEAYDASS